MAKLGETNVRQYLESRGLTVRKIPESNFKTVDFAVQDRGELAFYLEEKTLELTPVAWGSIDPVYNNIARHIKEAIRQFSSMNPDKNVPNVLAITSMDPTKTINHLFSTLTGQIITNSGRLQLIDKMRFIKDDLTLIDLYLWFDQDQFAGHIWEVACAEHQEKLTSLLGLVD
ncbi:MAG: hypothetical protein AVO34_08715 [Firmicutes bacterium ML8_F2]|jgi:hypothetical protein|nr:MAG: hypothetical protein AVO34_08715 [Firmicutes bacterium ML8_F2]